MPHLDLSSNTCPVGTGALLDQIHSLFASETGYSEACINFLIFFFSLNYYTRPFKNNTVAKIKRNQSLSKHRLSIHNFCKCAQAPLAGASLQLQLKARSRGSTTGETAGLADSETEQAARCSR